VGKGNGFLLITFLVAEVRPLCGGRVLQRCDTRVNAGFPRCARSDDEIRS
jgi:hypothetical protein